MPCSDAPFTGLFHYLPFLLLLLRNPAERIYFGENGANELSQWSKSKRRTDPWSACWWWWQKTGVCLHPAFFNKPHHVGMTQPNIVVLVCLRNSMRWKRVIMVISRCYFNSYNAFFSHIIPILRFLPLIPDLRKAGYLALCLQFSAKKKKKQQHWNFTLLLRCTLQMYGRG